jgi:hypothetical protein
LLRGIDFRWYLWGRCGNNGGLPRTSLIDVVNAGQLFRWLGRLLFHRNRGIEPRRWRRLVRINSRGRRDVLLPSSRFPRGGPFPSYRTSLRCLGRRTDRRGRGNGGTFGQRWGRLMHHDDLHHDFTLRGGRLRIACEGLDAVGDEIGDDVVHHRLDWLIQDGDERHDGQQTIK